VDQRGSNDVKKCFSKRKTRPIQTSPPMCLVDANKSIKPRPSDLTSQSQESSRWQNTQK